MTTTTNAPAHATGAGQPMFILALLTVAIVFFLAEQAEQVLHGSHVSEDSMALRHDAEQRGDSVSAGNAYRKVAYVMLAAMGVFFLLRRGGCRLRAFDPMALVILLYLAWCVTSVLWSVTPMLTIRRVSVLVLTFVGALGLSRQLSARQLAALALCVATSYVALGLGAEIALGRFRPWAGDYRFSGTVIATHQGPFCACLCLAALCLATQSSRHKRLLYLLALAGLTLLVLTKARTSVAALIGSLFMLWAVNTSTRSKVVTGFAAGWATCVLLLATFLLSAEKQMVSVAFLGREENVHSLTGRIPLWNELLPYIESRPLLGYGYTAFWSPKRILDVSLAVGWPIQSAHSMYLETLISVGLIGSAMLLLAVLTGCWRASAAYRNVGDPGHAFVFALLTFGMIQGLLASQFARPSFVPFIALCGLLQLAFYRGSQASVAEGGLGGEPPESSRGGWSLSPEEGRP